MLQINSLAILCNAHQGKSELNLSLNIACGKSKVLPEIFHQVVSTPRRCLGSWLGLLFPSARRQYAVPDSMPPYVPAVNG